MTPEEHLNSHGIAFTRHEHPAVFTCEESDTICAHIPGIACKTLFIKNKKSGNHFLLILPAKKRFDRKKMEPLVGTKDLSFGTPEDLKKKLGLTPGSVSPFGLLNNDEKDVALFIDQDVYNADVVTFHPNINTASLELNRENFHKFLNTLDQKHTVVNF